MRVSELDRKMESEFRKLQRADLIGKMRALESRLRVLSQRERSTGERNPLESYERGYRIGLAVAYAESAKKVRRAARAR